MDTSEQYRREKSRRQTKRLELALQECAAEGWYVRYVSRRRTHYLAHHAISGEIRISDHDPAEFPHYNLDDTTSINIFHPEYLESLKTLLQDKKFSIKQKPKVEKQPEPVRVSRPPLGAEKMRKTTEYVRIFRARVGTNFDADFIKPALEVILLGLTEEILASLSSKNRVELVKATEVRFHSFRLKLASDGCVISEDAFKNFIQKKYPGLYIWF